MAPPLHRSGAMLINYWKIAWRSISRFKGYTAINLTGLSLGLTAGILILLYVTDEISFDRFHEQRDRIYRVETGFLTPETGKSEGNMDANGWPVGATLRKDLTEVEAVLYTKNASFLTINHEGKRIQENSHFASPEFFEIFSYPLLKGSAKTALKEPFTVVINERLAEKYFRGQDPLNATLVIADTLSFIVTGVMRNIPSNSHIQTDMLLSFATYTTLDKSFSYDDGWGNINARNYVLLREGADHEHVRAKAKNLYLEHAGEMLKSWGVSAHVNLQPLNTLYLTARTNGMGPLGSVERLYLLSGIAAFVIILACINFINLTTARSVYRAREVGLRKVAGSTRQGLIKQFLSESFVLTLLAFLIATALVGISLPLFNTLLGKQYTLTAITTLPVLGGTLLLILAITLLSGYYPALVMSGMRPADVLKGKLQHSTKGVNLRRSLVVFQFMISFGLVMGMLLILKQLNFMQKQELGFAKDEIVVINASRAQSANPEAYQTFKDQLKSLAIVDDVSFTNSVPGRPGWMGQVAYPEGKSGDAAVSVEYMAVDEDYIPTLNLQVIAGTSFDARFPAHYAEGLILNETAVAMFGWGTPAEAIGRKITSPSGYPAGEVIGVVRDYHQFGLKHKIGSMVMDYNPGASHLYAIRYKAADTEELVSRMEDLWSKHFPGNDFNYFFLNDDFERQYQAEQRLVSVFVVFAVVTIVIALIGLLGLVSFMVAARTKEIGVRKVLGGDVLGIAGLLSKEFIILVAVANLVAVPLVWYFASSWLESFAWRITIDPLLFVVTFLMAILITTITVSFQTIRAAMADPIQSLRYE